MSEESPATRGQRRAREQRLAQAMRDNLKKRKIQMRARHDEADDVSPVDESGRSRAE